MFKHIFTALILLTATISARGAEASDTIINIANPSKVVIVESPDGVTFNIAGAESDSTFIVSYSESIKPGTIIKTTQKTEYDITRLYKHDKWDIISSHVLLGFNTGLGNNVNLEMSKSFEIAWQKLLGIRYKIDKTMRADFSFGIDWRTYRSTISERFIAGGDAIYLGPFPADVEPQFSRIKTFSLPFTLSVFRSLPVKVGRSRMGLEASVIASLNVYGSALNAWRTADGVEVEEFSKGIGLRKFTLEFMAALKICNGIGWYVKYSPYDVLCGPSPRFHTLTTGLVLGI
ncbi:MAG: hypothetical protein NC098_08375 [Lachnoclostridium sp.]|nr:hypothetical protein [Lachnoclostridium sp.]